MMIHLASPTELLAEIPTGLGYIPLESVIAVLLTADDGAPATPGVYVQRHLGDDMAGAGRELAAKAGELHVRGAVLVAVTTGTGASGIEALDTLGIHLARAGVQTWMKITATGVEGGSTWFEHVRGRTGRLGDSGTEGTFVPSRQVIVDRYTRVGEKVADELLARCQAEQDTNPLGYARATLGELYSTVEFGLSVSPELAAAVAVLVCTSGRMRDAVLSVGGYRHGEHLSSAIGTLADIAGRLDGPARKWTLTIAAVLAYTDQRWAEVGIIAATAAAEFGPVHNLLLEHLELSRLLGPVPGLMNSYLAAATTAAVELGMHAELF